MKTKQTILILAALSLFAAACEKVPATSGSAQDKQLEAAVQQYVPGVIYAIYGHLADASEQLYSQLAAMKESSIIMQEQIDQACATFLEAR